MKKEEMSGVEFAIATLKMTKAMLFNDANSKTDKQERKKELENSIRELEELQKKNTDKEVMTKAGKITTRAYDDGVAKGIQLLLNDEIICIMDVIEENGEVRILAYNSGDEPDIISLNR